MTEFSIHIPDMAIDDLHRLIDATRWPEQADAGWSEGTAVGYLRDPGVYNWLDTTGLPRGVFLYRVVDGDNLATPRTRVVALDAVRDELGGKRFVDDRERREQVQQRREGVSHMLLD